MDKAIQHESVMGALKLLNLFTRRSPTNEDAQEIIDYMDFPEAWDAEAKWIDLMVGAIRKVYVEKYWPL